MKLNISDRRVVTGFFIKLVAAIFLFILLTRWIFFFTVASGSMMHPKIIDGDIIISYRIDRSFAAGDAVAFIRPDNQYNAIGRIAAVEGDIVTIENGIFNVNGNPQTTEVYSETHSQNGIAYPYTVPQDSFFILGDNRTGCIDSRTYGAVHKSEILGKITMTIRSRGI